MTISPTLRQRYVAPKWARPVRLTPHYHEHVARGATMIEQSFWMLPGSYGDIAAEVFVLQSAAGMVDISDCGMIEIKSTEMDAFLLTMFPDTRQVRVGSSVLGDDLARLCRLTENHALLITSPVALADTLRRAEQAASARDCTHCIDRTGALCGLRLLGPRAASVLENLTSLDLAPDRFVPGAVAQGAIAKIHALVLRRDGAGPAGYEIYVDRDLGLYIWESLLESGVELGLRPIGRAAAEAVG